MTSDQESYSALNEMPCGYLRLSQSFIIEDVNAYLLRLLGFGQDANALIGHRLDAHLRLASKIFAQTHFFPMLTMQSEVNEVYLVFSSAAGEALPFMCNVAKKTTAEGDTFHCVFFPLVVREQYEQRLLSARKNAEDDIVRFSKMISHDLQESVRKIALFTDKVSLDASSGQVPDEVNLRKITEACKKLQQITTELLSKTNL